jgi:hypothetical protein
MQVDARFGGRNAFSRTNKQRIVKLSAQALQ